MIAKAEWYKKRKLGWGLEAVTWQAYVYGFVVGLITVIITGVLDISIKAKIIGFVTILGLVSLDTLTIYKQLKLDEREQEIELKAEKNASYAMATVLIIGVIYYIIKMIFYKDFYINPIIIIALFVGMIVKITTYHKLEK